MHQILTFFCYFSFLKTSGTKLYFWVISCYVKWLLTYGLTDISSWKQLRYLRALSNLTAVARRAMAMKVFMLLRIVDEGRIQNAGSPALPPLIYPRHPCFISPCTIFFTQLLSWANYALKPCKYANKSAKQHFHTLTLSSMDDFPDP